MADQSRLAGQGLWHETWCLPLRSESQHPGKKTPFIQNQKLNRTLEATVTDFWDEGPGQFGKSRTYFPGKVFWVGLFRDTFSVQLDALGGGQFMW